MIRVDNEKYLTFSFVQLTVAVKTMAPFAYDSCRPRSSEVPIIGLDMIHALLVPLKIIHSAENIGVIHLVSCVNFNYFCIIVFWYGFRKRDTCY